MTGALVVAGLGLIVVIKVYVSPLNRWKDQRISWANACAKLKRKNDQIAGGAGSIRQWAARTFDTDEYRANAKVASAVLSLVERAGLSPDKISLQLVHGSQVRGAYREIGRLIRVRGGLKSIVDFLYLLDAEPHLHRLDQLTITPVLKSNEVDLQVRYVTPLLDLKDVPNTPVDQVPTTAPAKLDAPERKLYEAIAARDLFRPYIQRPASPPPVHVASKPPKRTTPPPATPPSPASRFKVVGLPEWSDSQAVFVSDSSTGQTRAYKPGDVLGGGVIAMVDYRALPSQANPKILSPSRVILKIGPEYFAVELGEYLSAKRRLSDSDLPASLRELPASAPAEIADQDKPASDANSPVMADSVKKSAPAER